MRRDGLSAPNLCGPVTAQDTPGVFTVFVKNRAKKLKNGMSVAVGMPMISAPIATQAPTTAQLPAAKPAPVVSSPSTTPQQVVVAEVPAEATPKAEPIALEPLPVFPALHTTRVIPGKFVVHPQTKRVAAKRIVRRAKPVLAACSVPLPTAKPESKAASAKPSAKPAPSAKDESKKSEERKSPISATHHSKPLAGHRQIVSAPVQSSTPLKQE
jgi:hypothetical protein